MNIVTIDGIEYVPKTTVVSQVTLDALSKAYSIAFCYGIYDPDTEVEGKHLKEIWNLLQVVNEEFRFKR